MVEAEQSITNIFSLILETFISGIHDSIVQIAAHEVETSRNFSVYLLPQRQFTKRAGDITGLSFHGGRLLKDGVPVEALPQADGVRSFLNWLDHESVLVAHKADFDARMLTLCVEKTGLQDLFTQKVAGFADSIIAFKDLLPKQDSYTLVSLATNLANIRYSAHDASADVSALYELLAHTGILRKVQNYSFSREFVQHRIIQLKNKKANLSSFAELTKAKVIPKCTAIKLAESGVSKEHLKLAFEREGADGIRLLLEEHLGRSTHSANLSEAFSANA